MTDEEFFVPEPVLESQNRGTLVQEGTNQVRQVRVRSCLDRDEHEIGWAYLSRCIAAVNLREMNVLLLADNVQSFLPNERKVTAHQKMHVPPCRGQFATVIATNGAGPDYGDAIIHTPRLSSDSYAGGRVSY